jgi:hypothetical protein
VSGEEYVQNDVVRGVDQILEDDMAENVARMGERRNAHILWVGKRQRKPLGIMGRR